MYFFAMVSDNPNDSAAFFANSFVYNVLDLLKVRPKFQAGFAERHNRGHGQHRSDHTPYFFPTV